MTFDEWCDKERLSCQYSYQLDALEDAWNAAWDQQQRVIDEMHLMFKDHALVPKEPTEAMVSAGAFQKLQEGSTSDIYKAMIQAAQEVE